MLFRSDKHSDLISNLKARGLAGMVIQPGYYIDHIPQYICDAADQEGFPILELPSHFSFSEILHIMMHEINQGYEHLHRDFEIYNQLFTTISAQLTQQQALFLSPLEDQTYLFTISTTNTSTPQEGRLEECLQQIRSYLLGQAKHAIYEITPTGQAIFCLKLNSHRDLPAVAYDFHIKLTFISEQEGVNFHVGIDKITALEHLNLAFEHSLKCIDLLTDIAAKRGVCSYENFTFIKMFGFLYQNNRSFVLDNQALQILLNHDRCNGSNYVHTVRTYLAENCNVSRTADRLFIHRHTLTNRLQNITSLCNINFSDYYTRIYMSLALLIHDYFAV